MKNSIPFLDLKSQYKTIKKDVRSAVNRVLESQKFILGPELAQLEQEFCDYCQCKYAIGVSSGTDALLVSLMALNVGPGDEVITTSYSFFATVEPIVRLGARPVFVDIELDSYNIDTNRIEELISSRTKAIIPVHLFGQVADMNKIKALGEKYHIGIIEDAAQSIGAKYNHSFAGTIGEFGCFSFFPSKNLGGIGDGGMVVTNDANMAERIKLLRSHGSKSKYIHLEIGGNFRLDEIQAAVLRVKLKYLDYWAELRRENAKRYIELLKKELSHKTDIFFLPEEIPFRKHVYNQFVIRVNKRDRLFNHLRENLIGCEIYYPSTLPTQPCLEYLKQNSNDFKNSEIAAQMTLALPIYPELGFRNQNRIIKSISNFFSIR